MANVQNGLENPMTYGEQMLDLLKRQHQYFQDLQRLAQEQRDLIKAQLNEELLHLLGKRQKIVEAIGQLHRQSAPFRERWEAMKDLLSEPVRENIAVLLRRLQQALNSIIEHDRQDCQDLSAAKQQVADELNQTNKARAANAYYGQPKGPQSVESSGSNFQITG
jgi:chorismate mutase